MEDTMELIQQAHAGDKDARDKLVAENMGLVWSVVRRFSGRGCEMEDLIQIGSIGLIKAIDKFDLQYEVRLSTYAVPMIAGEIKRFLRDDGMIKVSRSLKELSYKAKTAREQLNIRLGREPTLEELAAEVGTGVEELAAAVESEAEVESLNKTIYQSDGNEIHLIDRIEEDGREDEEIIDRLALHKLIRELEPKERQIIVMRYYQDKTQTQIAGELGISQVQVSRLEKRILASMRKKID